MVQAERKARQKLRGGNESGLLETRNARIGHQWCVCVVGERSLRGCWEGRRSQETRDPEGQSRQVRWHSECGGGLEYALPKIRPSPAPCACECDIIQRYSPCRCNHAKVRPDWNRVGPNAMTVSLKEEGRAPQIPGQEAT